MRKFTASDLRHKLVLQKPGGSADDDGYVNKPENWVTVADDVYAAVWDVSGKEYREAAINKMLNVTTFVIRHRADISNNMQLLFDGNAYEIKHIDSRGYGRDFLIIKAEMVKGEGGADNGM